MEMDKIYNSNEIESKWRQYWDNEKLAKFSLDDREVYSICLPPPNVTGSLHMGHAFQQSLMDLLIRYNKMSGKNVLWQVGVDHAGIATQLIVQNKLKKEYPEKSFSKEELIEEIWKWKEESGNLITEQMQFMGNFIDWDRSRFTMDKEFSELTRDVFIKLYEKGLIYKGEKLVNWDTNLQTAVSDLEVVSEEKNGLMYHIKYMLEDGSNFIEVATTRPETLFGDVAVAVHPESPHKNLIGSSVIIPISHRKIKIIADEMVDMDFGSGFVKITPAHDFNDFEVGLRHSLKPIKIMNLDGTLNENVPSEYVRLDRFVARKKIVAELEATDLLIKKEQKRIMLPISERTGVVVEPMLTQQWFMKMKDLAEDAISLAEKDEIKFYPENWKNTYYSWLNDIKDWCISRQLVWGHRVPVFYDEKGNEYVAFDEEEVRKKYNLDSSISLSQDNDVLDTWFSSALWTFVTLGWKKDEALFSKAHPSAVLVTGFDIIFFWVARMIMMTREVVGEIPFKEIYFTGLVRDAHGQKMSKSKGNVIDPVDLIKGITLDELLIKRTGFLISDDKKEGIIKQTKKDYPMGIESYGIDSLRATFCALSNGGRDIKFDFLRLKGYRNFTNKIWNASKFVFMNCEDFKFTNVPSDLSMEDKWILNRLSAVIDNFNKNIQEYRFDYLINNVYDFFWHDYCDWYVEVAKISMKNNPEQKYVKQYVLLTVLENAMRILHPIMPFITEEIWQRVIKFLPQNEKSIILKGFPKANYIEDENFSSVLEVIKSIRAIKSHHKLQKNHLLKIYLIDKIDILKSYYFLIEEMTGVTIVEELSDKYFGFDIINDIEVYFLDGLDIIIEKQRLLNKVRILEENMQKLEENYSKDLIESFQKQKDLIQAKIVGLN